MDRGIVYPGQIPLDTDVLRAQRFAHLGLGYLARAVFGSNAAADGLTVVPNSPQNLTVQVTPGSLYIFGAADATGYGGLAANSESIGRQGILTTTATLTITPPATAGHSQNYLIQAAISDVDQDPVVLPYYNSANPSVAFAGPANSGTSQNTTRRTAVTLSAKPGASAPTGTQTTPTPDPGFVSLAVVTVAQGQTQILTNNIALANAHPYVTWRLQEMVVNARSQSPNWLTAGGTSTAVTLSPFPSFPSLASLVGVPLRFIATSAVGASPTMNVNGLGAVSIVWSDGTTIRANEWVVGNIVEVIYDGTVFRYMGSLSPSAINALFAPSNRRQVFTSSGTFTVPNNVTVARVTVIGGGGGSGASANATAGGIAGNMGAGGGGGGFSQRIVTGLTPGGTVTVTVGAGGAAGQVGVNGGSGQAGGTSSFGAFCSATGGNGGLWGENTLATAGTGGTGSGGDINIQGGDGGFGGQNSAGTPTISDTWRIYGRGGVAPGGFAVPSFGGTGAAGRGFGAGGGGSSGGSGVTGAVGAAGVVIVEW